MGILEEVAVLGLTGAEAVQRAKHWWNTLGRHLVPAMLNERLTTVIAAGGPAPGIISRTRERDLPSGLLNRLPFDDLARGEKLHVVKVWVHTVFRAEEGMIQ
jgi:hypothetical protein